MLIKPIGGGLLALCCSAAHAGERTLNWTPGTTFLVSVVPDPTTYGMLVFGLALVGVAARRQRRFLRG